VSLTCKELKINWKVNQLKKGTSRNMEHLLSTIQHPNLSHPCTTSQTLPKIKTAINPPNLEFWVTEKRFRSPCCEGLKTAFAYFTSFLDSKKLPVSFQ
jgi:hypothetical protein